MNGAGRPRVSVVTPFLNAARFIEEAVESVLAQTCPDWELLLVDDGSIDASSDIARRYARSYPGRIHYIEHPDHANRGTAASRNTGAQRSSGEFLAYLDADDVWLPHKLERQIALLDASPRASLIYGASQYWYSWSGSPADASLDHVCDVGVPPETLIEPPDLLRLLLDAGIHTPGPTAVMIRRQALERCGGFEDAWVGPLQLYEDQAFLAKVFFDEAVLVSTECWDRYRIHDASCDSRVFRSGDDGRVRAYFLRWLHEYMSRHPRGREHAELIETARALAADPGAGGPSDDAGEGDVRRLKWWLRATDSNTASLEPLDRNAEAVRVIVALPDGRPSHDVQLNVARLAVKAGHRYALSFGVRVEAPRQIHVAFSRAYAPWTNLCLYEAVDVHAGQQHVTREFVANDDSVNARIHFDIGEHAGAIELADVRLMDLGAGSPVEPDIPRPALPFIRPSRSTDHVSG